MLPQLELRRFWVCASWLRSRVWTSFLPIVLGFGCLPDPPIYDPCTNSESYYTVPPTGCNHHDLTILAEWTHRSNTGQTMLGQFTMVVDDTDIYWPTPSGDLLRTPKRGGETVPLVSFESELTFDLLNYEDSLIALLCDPLQSFYIGCRTVTIDKPSSRVTFQYASPGPGGVKLGVYGDHYYITDYAKGCLVQSTLGDDTTPPRCITTTAPTEFQFTTDGLFFVAATAYDTSLFFQPFDASEPKTLGIYSPFATSFEAHGNTAQWVECEGTCRLVQLDTDAERKIAIADLGYGEILTGDGTENFVFTRLPGDWSEPKLYGYARTDAPPELLAASLGELLALDFDESYVYAAVRDYSDEQLRILLLRIER